MTQQNEKLDIKRRISTVVWAISGKLPRNKADAVAEAILNDLDDCNYCVMPQALSALCAQMEAALEKCGERFREYERLHAAKPDMEKAARNADMAVMCETALTAYRTLSPDPVYAEAKNMLALLDGVHTCPECERMVGKIWHEPKKHMGDCDIGNTINRARGGC